MSNQPETTVVPNGDGTFTHVPGAQVQQNQPSAQRHPLAGIFNLQAVGITPSKTDWTDTVEIGPVTFRIREVGQNVLLSDDDFTNRMIRELGLEELAASYYDYSGLADPAAALRNAARVLLTSDAFRGENEELSIKADQLVQERYENVLFGVDGISDDPRFWGGLVGWTMKGVPANEVVPFSVEAARGLNLKTKLDLYERILGLSRGGLSDARFRRANGG